MIVLLIALGAAVGAPARYLTDRAVQSRHDTALPWGTVTVNVVASLVSGFVAGAVGHLSLEVQALVATGFCGAVSTFSTFSYETLRLAQDGRRSVAVTNVVVSVAAALGAAALGWVLGSAL
ncbi:MAG TPA: fluoride efflux transporter CrcB [Jatrophihabitans sp.]|uniref:fluoride efflux transporter CrcB n=1 Tax=Jatrophihabitans sp. TaxID=1932789 RepID=UPI002E095BDF|nr:fluoride efflux transporter CrcB [Jatrophihabitans sp.]